MKKSLFSRMLLFFMFCTGQYSGAQTIGKQTAICNPLNLNYRFQLNNPSRREVADPVIVTFKGKYFLFASKSGGYWVSTNLTNWSFITTNDLPIEDYAPTAVVINDIMYFMAVNNKIYKSADPLFGEWQIAKESFSVGKRILDPTLFLDEDGRLFLYMGLATPIKVIELNPKTFDPVGELITCVKSNKNDFGWEQGGDYNNDQTQFPCTEGAWMTKHGSKYYLQYAVPATQFKSYADGLYISDSPLGPFKVADNNPFSYKPEGFIAGAGHSSTFQDKWGNYWHIVSMTISVKHPFERRLGMFPAFFDKDGTFYTYTGFGDFPHIVPQKHMNGPEDYKPSGMLLSYKKPVEVSSTLANHPKEYATNEEIRDYWSAQTGNKGEWIMIDLEKQCKVSSVQLNFAEEGTTILGRLESIYYQYLLEYSNDKKVWKTLSNKTKSKIDAPHDYIELKVPVTARYIRLTNYHVPDGKFALSGLRIFGNGNGKTAQAVSAFTVIRDNSDGRNVTLKWKMSENATGYNIRYGTAPDKLYLNYQVLGADSLTIHSLSKLQKYYFTIDVFNENGITKGLNIQSIEMK